MLDWGLLFSLSRERPGRPTLFGDDCTLAELHSNPSSLRLCSNLVRQVQERNKSSSALLYHDSYFCKCHSNNSGGAPSEASQLSMNVTWRPICLLGNSEAVSDGSPRGREAGWAHSREFALSHLHPPHRAKPGILLLPPEILVCSIATPQNVRGSQSPEALADGRWRNHRKTMNVNKQRPFFQSLPWLFQIMWYFFFN